MAQQGASLFQVTELGPLAKGMRVPLVLYPATYLLLVLRLRVVEDGPSIDTELAERSDQGKAILGVD